MNLARSIEANVVDAAQLSAVPSLEALSYLAQAPLSGSRFES